MKKKLTMENLERAFNNAKEGNFRYFAVKVSVPSSDYDEVIINPMENSDKKLEYYKKAYTDDLILKAFDQIFITDFTYADSYDTIEDYLI